MEGRRVSSHKSKKYNPLFILFLCLVAAVIVLLVVSVVLGLRLNKVNKTLKESEASVKELTQTVSRLGDELEKAKKTGTGAGTPAPALPSGSSGSGTTAPASSSSWLDLSGHNEVKVQPTELLDGYTVYYTTAGLNLRSGPGKDYDRITTLDYGDKVQVAARENGWSFIKAGGKFGWVSSDYLSTKEPAPETASKPSSSSRVETTSGNLQR